MNKIWLIIRREYWSRVSKKTFLLTTLGLPILMFGFSALIGFIAAKSGKDYKIAVVDESKLLQGKMVMGEKDEIKYLENAAWPAIKSTYKKQEYDLLIHVKPITNLIVDSNSIEVYSESSLSFDANIAISKSVNRVLRGDVLNTLKLETALYDSIQGLNFPFKNITSDKKGGNANIAFIIGQIVCFLIYFVILIYGSMVMRGVMEEKTNRIAEVMISSVKPFQLMMGKIIGIALVGLTQFLIWGIFALLMSAVAGLLLPSMGVMPSMTAMPQGVGDSTNQMIFKLMQDLKSFNISLILICFVLYFLGGYFLYASLFAVVGSMVNEDAAEAQSLSLPISMPIIVSLFIGMQAAKDPDSGLAVFASIFPFTSPIVMMTRLAYSPPMWQIILSIALLILTFIGTSWLASKIYRTSILMYGKKLSWKEVWKWI
jgi:ABC-2 type transport system permease protein